MRSVSRESGPRLAALLGGLLAFGMASRAAAQEAVPTPPPLPSPSPTAPEPVTEVPLPTTNAELLEEIRRLRSDVSQVNSLRREVEMLQGELSSIRQAPPGYVPGPAAGGSGPPMSTRGGSPAPRVTTTHSGTTTVTEVFGPPDHPTRDNFPLAPSYRYNYGTGALGGGGYTHIGDEDGEFSLNLTNQLTLDGTFFDRVGMPTTEKGFNVPFARTFIYGNVTKNWTYQIGTQGFLGEFNLLDVWGAYRFGDALTIRFGKGLTPPLYEYYGFSPAMEPVITNSPLFQLAGKRQLGVMASGSLFDGRMQYWAGVNNPGTSFWYALNDSVEFNGAVTFTPFAPSDGIFKALGGGVGFSSGYDDYALNRGTETAFINGAGEPTTNSAFVTSSGVPFFTYNDGLRSRGVQTRVAPHIFWFGRFSVLAEYMNFSRVLEDTDTRGRSTQRAYYVNVSYWLTGERDYPGNGFQGYSTVAPLSPWRPSRGEFGPGAWQIAAQWAEFNVGTGDFARGFSDRRTSTNRMGQMMVGLNWWPNRYTRLSFDYVWTGLNRPIPINTAEPIDTWGTYWFRYAMFF